MTYPLRHIDDEWHRLIPSRFPPVDVYERFGTPELRAMAKEVEDKTNPRLRAKAWLLGKAPYLGETSPRLQNWNHAPFAYRNPEGSTFLNAGYGVLEVMRGERAALAWSLQRREVFLERTREPPIGLDMRLLVTGICGDFADLTNASIDMDETERWKLGDQLLKDGASGVLFHRPEQLEALALAIFDNRVLGRSIQSSHYRFVWDGSSIASVYDFTDGKEIQREELLAPTGTQHGDTLCPAGDSA